RLNTASRSRGASNTRVIEMPYSAVTESLVEAVEAVVPEAAVGRQEVCGLLQRLAAQPRGPKLRRAPALDQARALEHREMLRHRLNADRKRLRQLVHGRLTVGEPLEDRATRGVGEGGEGRAELVCRHVVTFSVEQPSG